MKANKERLLANVSFLTNIRPYRNYKNPDSLEKAASYINEEFRKAGLPAVEQKWIAKGKEYKNIIASYEPGKLKRLIIGAHYDVAGNQKGADDNASGIAGLLEIARLLSENRPVTDYGIDLVAYCLEEPPFFGTESMGSFVHAESLFRKMTPVIGMVCFEMIGCFSDKPDSQDFPPGDLKSCYPGTGNFIMIAGIEKYKGFNDRFHILMSMDSKIDVQVISLPDNNGYAGLSDHRNYWTFGYKALMINDTCFFRNKNYHKKSDTIDKIDFGKMAEVVNSAFNAITKVCLL
jgi:hypothetical protein